MWSEVCSFQVFNSFYQHLALRKQWLTIPPLVFYASLGGCTLGFFIFEYVNEDSVQCVVYFVGTLFKCLFLPATWLL